MDDLRQLVKDIFASATPSEKYASRQSFFATVGIALHPGQRRVDDEIDQLRVILLWCGERWGKSEYVADFASAKVVEPYILVPMKLAQRGIALPNPEVLIEVFGNRLYWIIGPDYTQARKEFDYMVRNLMRYQFIQRPGENVSMPKDGAWKATCVDGTVIETKTAEDIRKIAAEAPNGVIMAEPAQTNLEAFVKARGRVAEKRGWVLLGGTNEPGAQWFRDLFYQWQDGIPEIRAKSWSGPSWENTFIYPGGRNDPEILEMERIMHPDMFQERIAALPSSRQGLCIPEFNKLIHSHSDVVYREGSHVWLAIDPSGSGKTQRSTYVVLACQFWPRANKEEPWGYDTFWELAEHNLTTQDIVKKVLAEPWSKDLVGIVMDIAGRQHSGTSQYSHQEIWKNMAKLPVYDVKTDVQNLIDRHRSTLKVDPTIQKPHWRIHSACTHTIDEYAKWRFDKKGAPIDDHCDSIKALGYFELYHFGVVAPKDKHAQFYIPIPFERNPGHQAVHRIRNETLPAPFWQVD